MTRVISLEKFVTGVTAKAGARLLAQQMAAENITAEASAAGVSGVAAAFDGFSRRHLLPARVIEAGQVALDELLSNIVKAGFEPGIAGRIDVSFDLSGPTLEIVVSYNGAPFDPLARKDPDTQASLDDRAVGGLGIYLVKKLMDGVTYERVGGENRLRMTKRIDA